MNQKACHPINYNDGLRTKNHMSNPRAKQERSKAKDTRQGIVEQKPVSSSLKKKSKYKITAQYHQGCLLYKTEKDRFSIGKYTTLAGAEQALKSLSKYSFYTELRIEEI